MPQFQNKNRVEFRASKSLLAHIAARCGSSQPGTEPNRIAERDLERYYYALEQTLRSVELTEQEALLICDAMNGVLVEPHTAQLLWAQIADAVEIDGLDRKWGVDGAALTAKLRGLSYAQALAVSDAVERWWSGPCRDTDGAMSLRKVGLVKAPAN